jgi:hypothetical protein
MSILKDIPLLEQFFARRGAGSVAIGDVTGLGTGVATSLAIAPTTAGGITLYGGAVSATTVTTSGLVRVGGATSSFPALKASGATLQARLADDSAYAVFSCGNIISGVSAQGSITASNSSGASVIQMSGSINYGYHAGSTVCHSWGNNATLNGSLDTSLSRVSAGVVGVGSGGAAGDITGALSCNQLILSKTITAPGTTGAQTINKSSGSVNFAAAATSLVVTNSLVSTSSIIRCHLGTNDATAVLGAVVAAAGSFTIYLTTAATAETRVNFVLNN